VPSPFVELEIGERLVKVTNPEKIYFRELGAEGGRKIDLVEHYLAVGDGIVRALFERPCTLKRHPEGAEGEAIYQKRVPEKRPEWVESVRVDFPSGRHAYELCVTEVASVAWAANLGTLDFHPWPSRRADTEHPAKHHLLLRVERHPDPTRELNRRVADRPGRLRHPHHPRPNQLERRHYQRLDCGRNVEVRRLHARCDGPKYPRPSSR